MLRTAALTIAAVGLAVGACSDDPTGRDRQAAPAGGDADATVEISGMAFSDQVVEVPTGGTVAWRWDDGPIKHDVAFDDGPASLVQSSGTWERTFDAAGSYEYLCTLHPSMTGTVHVG